MDARARPLGADWTINGSIEHRYRGNLNIRRDGLDVARLMSDLRDIAFSAGSACASGSGRPSHVLRAIGLSDARGAVEHPARLRPLHDRGANWSTRSTGSTPPRARNGSRHDSRPLHRRDGTRREVDRAPGDRLLDVAQADGQPLEGTCEGQMACSTCHVIVDPADFARLPRASEEEEDMLDLAAGATRTSRLSARSCSTRSMRSPCASRPRPKNMQGR